MNNDTNGRSVHYGARLGGLTSRGIAANLCATITRDETGSRQRDGAASVGSGGADTRRAQRRDHGVRRVEGARAFVENVSACKY